MIKPSCLIKVPSSIDGGTFFHWWIRFLTPFHALTGREMDVAAALFQHRYELSRTITDPFILDQLVLNSNSRENITKRLGLSPGYINVILTKLRKRGVIKDGRLNPRFIPNINQADGIDQFSVLLVFDFKEDAKGKKTPEEG